MNRLIILLIFSLVLFGCSSNKNVASDNWLTFEDQYFEISYPDNWEHMEMKEHYGMKSFISPRVDIEDDFRENVNVIVQDLSAEPMTLAEYTQLSKQELSNTGGESSILSIKSVQFGELEASELIYKMPKGAMAGIDRELKFRQIYLVENNRAYILTYTAEPEEYDNYYKVGKDIFDSFKLKSSNTTL